MHRFLLLCALLISVTVSVNCQQAPNIIPSSPTASALGKYGDIPISLYTGIPNISIPIYELKGTHLSLPISLSYHGGGGVKVEENSSWCGLNWVLNAGGVITRTTRGLRDEGNGGYMLTLRSQEEKVLWGGSRTKSR